MLRLAHWLAVLPLAACVPAPALVGGDPADPRAVVPVQAHVPFLRADGRFRPVEPADWRELNDRAGRIGGGAGQMRGASDADPVPTRP
ncbi:hypothetical protein STVA_14320 [Allostella vacuolata]|nr:hypothetical protein STVA_14320 [Stella vacuolata]